ncbi:MAG: C69 family dipeptidase [Pseudomonadota bacterium]
MCDTLLAFSGKTADGSVILAKNSDREPGEAQAVTFVPAARHAPGAVARCASVTIPQARETFAALISRPFWMPGAEMGVNEHSVAVGNEAVFTRRKVAKTGLTGMDLVRLALTRGRTAREAVRVVTGLIAAHGQGGNGGYRHRLQYHNSFLVADPSEAWLLETADREWAARRVTGFFCISNALCLDEAPDAASPGAPEPFAKSLSDRLFTRFARGRARRALAASFLENLPHPAGSRDLMAALRVHADPVFAGGRGKSMDGLCLHAGGLVSSQTTGSMVAVLHPGRPPLAYFTGTSAPCLSVFKPHSLAPGQAAWPGLAAGGDQDLYGSPGKGHDPGALWWEWERFHRRALLDYNRLAPDWQRARDAREAEMAAQVEAAWKNGGTGLSGLCARWAGELAAWQSQEASHPAARPLSGKRPPAWFRLFWALENRRDQMPRG